MSLRQNVHWAFVLLAYMTLLSQSILDNARGPAYPNILESFSINASRGAYLFAWASFAGLIAQMSARWWLPRIEVVIGSMISLALMALGSFLFGQSSEVGLWLLDTSSVIMGLGMGAANVTMNLLIARGTPLSHRRQFYAGLHSVYGLGSLSAPLLLAFYLSSETASWGGFFCWLIILPLLTLILSLIQKNELQHESVDLKLPKKVLSAPAPKFLRLAYGLVFGFYVAAEIVISSRLVIYLNHGHKIDIDMARLALSCFFLALLAGRLLFTVVPIKGSSQRWLLLSCASTLIVYGLARTINPLFMALTGLTMSYFYPVAMDWLSKKFPQGLEWMTASVLTSVSIMLIVMHVGFGYVSDILGIEMAMALVPFFITACFSLLLMLGKAQ